MRGRGSPQRGRTTSRGGVNPRGRARPLAQDHQGEGGDESGGIRRIVANPAIRQYFNNEKKLPSEPWTELPEIPSPSEVTASFLFTDYMNGEDEKSAAAMLDEGEGNLLIGPWSSKLEYLRTHYKLLREDSVRPLRNAISKFKANPNESEDPNDASVGIYDNVFLTGIKLAARGIAFRFAFSLNKVGKNVKWEQSKRLVSGSLVALLDPKDLKAPPKLAVVASRHKSDLDTPPLEVHLFFPSFNDMMIDCQKEWIIVEARSGYYEAQRHILKALQQMTQESLPLAKYLVDLDVSLSAPKYLADNPLLSLNAILSPNSVRNDLERINAFNPWPSNLRTCLDESQLLALKKALTKELAIIQGPPGTGKTFVSVQILKVLLSSMGPQEPPIVITAQTNHSLDQLLRHISEYCPEFVRLGGRTKDQGVILSRTLYNLKNLNPPPRMVGCSLNAARNQLKKLKDILGDLVSPLTPSSNPISPHILQHFGLLSEEQCRSLEDSSDGWIHAGQSADRNRFISWLGNQFVQLPRPGSNDIRFEEFEENERVMEEIKETEAENVLDDEEFDELTGAMNIHLGDEWGARGSENTSAEVVKDLLSKNKDLWAIPAAYRAPVYRYLLAKTKEILLKKFNETAEIYIKTAQERRIGTWEEELVVLQSQKIIGVTTTGMSKYRPLLAALKPKIVLVEEAAETLEAPIIASCLESLEHLILVGDHKQLRPRCNVQELEEAPFNLNVSMFERLVNNNMPYSLLDEQRRMHPGISRLLAPIYGEGAIKDHPSVLDKEMRPTVPGMGKLRTWFHSHDWVESRDEQMSSLNHMEAEMILGFIKYLIKNGTPAAAITVLTFYNGQRRRLLQGIWQDPSLKSYEQSLKITTVDSYQGEENDVIILSLVRSANIGFVGNENRTCVALSRARRGLYIFGNHFLLRKNSEVWKEVIKILVGPRESVQRIGDHLRIQCTTHQRDTQVLHPTNWKDNEGGCTLKCGVPLPCGHECASKCHPPKPGTHECQVSSCSTTTRTRSRDTLTVGARGELSSVNQKYSNLFTDTKKVDPAVQIRQDLNRAIRGVPLERPPEPQAQSISRNVGAPSQPRSQVLQQVLPQLPPQRETPRTQPLSYSSSVKESENAKPASTHPDPKESRPLSFRTARVKKVGEAQPMPSASVPAPATISTATPPAARTSVPGPTPVPTLIQTSEPASASTSQGASTSSQPWTTNQPTPIASAPASQRSSVPPKGHRTDLSEPSLLD